MRRRADGIDSLAPLLSPSSLCADAVGRWAPGSEFREAERDESGFRAAQVITAPATCRPVVIEWGGHRPVNQQLIDAARAIPE
jgi:hypothetical protein